MELHVDRCIGVQKKSKTNPSTSSTCKLQCIFCECRVAGEGGRAGRRAWQRSISNQQFGSYSKSNALCTWHHSTDLHCSASCTGLLLECCSCYSKCSKFPSEGDTGEGEDVAPPISKNKPKACAGVTNIYWNEVTEEKHITTLQAHPAIRKNVCLLQVPSCHLQIASRLTTTYGFVMYCTGRMNNRLFQAKNWFI